MSHHLLVEKFYQSFDATRITQFLTRIAAMKESDRRSHPDFLGEGTHFQSFELATHPIPLAINVAKESFLKRGPKAIERWRASILDLRQLEMQDLIPPMEVIQFSELTAIAMPRGKSMTRKGAEAKGLAGMILETSRALGKAGLVLDDYPQLVECSGQYFINDWSDLSQAG